MYGIAIKLWSSEFNLEAKGYNTLDSVVYLFEDRSREDLRYLANTVKHLVGNDSLDNIFEKFFPNSFEGYVKGKYRNVFRGLGSGGLQIVNRVRKYPKNHSSTHETDIGTEFCNFANVIKDGYNILLQERRRQILQNRS